MLAVNNVLHELKACGFELSLDDFSSGYSSIPILRKLFVDTIKIDRKTLLDAEKHKRSYTILHSLVNLALQLDMSVVVEGVETEAQENIVKDLATDIAQGYKYYKPMSQDDFLALINNVDNI